MLLRRVLSAVITTITITALLWLGASIALAAPPDNDDFDGAIVIGALPFNDTRDTREATVAEDDPFPFCGGREATVWYTFTPDQAMRLEIDTTGSSYAASVSVYTGARGSLNQLVCGSTQVNVDLAANISYFIMLGAYSGGPYPGPGGGGDLVVSMETLPAPANDDFDQATVVSSLPFSDAVDTRGATTAADDPFPGCIGFRAATVWYAFTPSQSMRLTFNTLGSDYNASLALFTGTRGVLNEVTCAGSEMMFQVQADTTYYLMVASTSAIGGHLALSIDELPAPANDDFDNATVISALPFSDIVDTRGATVADDDPFVVCGSRHATVWYAFTPDHDLRLEATTVGSNYAVGLAVFTGSRGALDPVACRAAFDTFPLRLDLLANTTYYFMVFADFTNSGNLSLALEELPVLSNDDFDNATPIEALPFNDSVDTRGAGAAPDDPNCFGQGQTVWYALTPSETLRVEANTFGSDYDTTLSVYTGARGALTQLLCSNDAAFTTQSQLRFEATPGQTYYIMVGAMSFGFPAQGGHLAFALDVLPPTPGNDLFENATAIGALPFTESLDTVNATTAADDPFLTCAGERVATVWYSFTPTQPMVLEASTAGSNYNTRLAVYTGARGALTEVVCNDDVLSPFPGFDTTSEVRFAVEAGQTYFFMIGDSFGGFGGNLVFSLEELTPPANDEFDQATVISSLPFTNQPDTRAATLAPDDPFPSCINERAATLWYAFTPDEAGRVALRTSGSDYNVSLSVYTGAPGNLTEVACQYFSAFSGPLPLRLDVVAGQTYFIMAAGFNTGGILHFDIQEVPPGPVNDDFDNATLISDLPFSDTSDTSTAIASPDDPIPFCSGFREATVWYSFTPTQTRLIEINNFGSSYNPTLSVYTGSRGALTQVACGFVQLNFTAQADTTYFVMVASTFDPGGSLTLAMQSFEPPANDDFDNAVAMTSLPFSDNRNTFGATRAADDPDVVGCFGTPEASVWYTVTLEQAAVIALNTNGSDYSPLIAVFTGSRGALTLITCGFFEVDFSAEANVTYAIMISSNFITSGNLALSAQIIPPPANDAITEAVVVSGLPFEDQRDTRAATTTADDPLPSCLGGRSATVWYVFTPEQTVTLDVSTFATNYPSGLAIFTGAPGALTEVACSSGQQLRLAANAATPYYLMVASTSGIGGNLSVSFQGTEPPANDDFDNALNIGALPFEEFRNTLGATAASDDPIPTCSPFQGASVWYSFTSDQATTISINANLSDYGTLVSVFTGARGALTQITCGFSHTSFNTEPGTTYFILVASMNDRGGTLLISVQSFTPASFTVDSFVDEGDANPGDGVCATSADECTLRAAIQETNALPSGDTITLPAGTYPLSLVAGGEDGASVGDLDITGNLILNGAGADTTIIRGEGEVIVDRVFHVFYGTVVQLTGLTIENGQASGSYGGGLFNSGDLSLVNVAVRNNVAIVGGGMYNEGRLTLINSSVSDNVVAGGGGGLSNSQFGSAILIGVTFSGNTAANGNGGAVEVNNGILTVVNSTFSGNTAAFGGGFLVVTGSLDLSNVTIANNTATSVGGGLVVFDGTGANVSARNIILAGNLGLSHSPDCNGLLSSQGHNLIQNTENCAIVGDLTGNLTGVDPLLGPLQDNGGPTLTHALLPGSPAINAGNPAIPGSGDTACEAVDQRGVARPIGSACDIGAFEAESTNPLTLALTLDKKGSLDRTGHTVTISGIVTCSQPATVELSGTLVQKIGRRIIEGSFDLTVACSGATAWSVTVTGEDGRFVQGTVRVSTEASAIDPVTGDPVETDITRKVVLRKTRR